MKKLLNKVSIMLLLVMLLSSITPLTYAAAKPEGEIAETDRFLFNPITGDQYTTEPFSSLAAANAYFKWNSYSTCSVYYQGYYFNYYYLFSNDTRQYFYVKCVDEDPIHEIPTGSLTE